MSCVTLRTRCTGTDFTIRQGDLLPAFEADAAEDCGEAFDFTDWTLEFRMSGPVEVTGVAVGDEEGAISYSWAAGDTDVPGAYAAWIVGTSPEAVQRTFPARGNITVFVEPA
jgi:hypothetical protein